MSIAARVLPAGPGEPNVFPKAAVPYETRPSRNWSAERDALNEFARLGLVPSERLVLHAIVIHIASHDEGWPTQPTIVRLTGLSLRQVRRSVDALIARGILASRLVAPGGALPDGTRTESSRLVYRRGPGLLRPPPRKCTPGRPLSNPEPTPAASRAPGPGDRVHPVMVTAKGDQEQTNKPSPLPPRPAVERPALRAAPPERGKIDDVMGGDLRAVEARAVLVHWQKTLWPELRGQVDTRRRLGVVLARFADGFTIEELRHVADAAKESAWHQAHPASLMADVLYDRPEMVERLAIRGRELVVARERKHAVRERRLAEEAVRDREWRSLQQTALSPAAMAAAARAVLASLKRNE